MARIRKVDGQKVKELREDRWWTQAELAGVAKVTRTTVIDIESGRNHSPRRGTIKALASALEVEPNDLLEDHRSPLAEGRWSDLSHRPADQPALPLRTR